MGRKKVPGSLKRDSISISLPRHIIERLDLLTSRRSKWIEVAIKNRIDDAHQVEALEDRQLIGILHHRFKGTDGESLVNLLRKQLLD